MALDKNGNITDGSFVNWSWSKEELATHSEYIELTTENFDDYIEIVEE